MIEAVTSPKFRIGVDLDGVSADSFGHILTDFNRKFGTAFALEDITEYHFLESAPIGQEDERIAFLNRAYQDPEIYFVKSLPMPEAVEYTNKLEAQGHKIFYVTMRRPILQEGTREWLERHRFPLNGNLHFRPQRGIDSIEYKVSMVKELGLDVFIEDSLDIAEGIADQTGIEVILFDYPWNQQSQGKKDLENLYRIVDREKYWGLAYKKIISLANP